MFEDEEDYDLVYTSGSDSEPDVDLENQYYSAKSLKVIYNNFPKNPT